MSITGHSHPFTRDIRDRYERIKYYIPVCIILPTEFNSMINGLFLTISTAALPATITN